MFGLLETDSKKVRRLRAEFEDLRRFVLYKMNPYEQYAFGSVLEHVSAELETEFAALPENDYRNWSKLSKDLRRFANKAFNEHRKGPYLYAEGGRAGASGVALRAMLAKAKSIPITEARLLELEITAFQNLAIEHARDAE